MICTVTSSTMAVGNGMWSGMLSVSWQHGSGTQLWAQVYNNFGKDHYWLCVYGTTLLTWTVFWIPNLLLMAMDLTAWPAALLRFKVQPDKNVPVSRNKLGKVIALVIFNQTAVFLPTVVMLYHVLQWRGCGFAPDSLPSGWRMLGEIAVFAVFEEIGFYYFHREKVAKEKDLYEKFHRTTGWLFHHPVLYRHVHKQHHEWTAPVGLVALYAHPLEMLVANLLRPVVLGSHLCTLWVWLMIVLFSTTVHHSGYHFPLLQSPQFHDFHHLN